MEPRIRNRETRREIDVLFPRYRLCILQSEGVRDNRTIEAIFKSHSKLSLFVHSFFNKLDMESSKDNFSPVLDCFHFLVSDRLLLCFPIPSFGSLVHDRLKRRKRFCWTSIYGYRMTISKRSYRRQEVLSVSS